MTARATVIDWRAALAADHHALIDVRFAGLNLEAVKLRAYWRGLLRERELHGCAGMDRGTASDWLVDIECALLACRVDATTAQQCAMVDGLTDYCLSQARGRKTDVQAS